MSDILAQMFAGGGGPFGGGSRGHSGFGGFPGSSSGFRGGS